MFDKFCDYMYYLLTSPFKRIKKSINQWYILFRVLGRRLDDALESLYMAEEQTMLATCEPEMLSVHAEDRKMVRYPGEEDENFRARIANYPEVLKLGGTDEGVLLAIKTLGYRSPELIKANEFIRRRHRGDEISDQLPNRWAEFYIVIKLDADEYPPISTEILKMEVRKTKQVGAKDNYFFQYALSIMELHTIKVRVLFIWRLLYWNYRRLDGTWLLDGNRLLNANRTRHRIKSAYRAFFDHKEMVCQVKMYKQHDYFYLNGSWKCDGSKFLDAGEKETIFHSEI